MQQAARNGTDDDHFTQEWRAGQSGQRLKPALYLVATPIGNLRDISMRALDVLHAADVVLCEDTRVAQKLLSVFGLHKKLERCDEHMEKRRIAETVEHIRAGKIFAFISDAGTPGISDPGAMLVAGCREAGVPVSPVPGASAVIAAVSVTGLEPMTPFTFLGFLPVKSGARRKVFQEWRDLSTALVLYEAPQRVGATLDDIAAILGQRHIMIARELTKLHETLYSGTPEELIRYVSEQANFKGEVVLVIHPSENGTEQALWDEVRVDMALTELLPAMSLKEAVANVTAQSGLPRKTVYARALMLDKK